MFRFGSVNDIIFAEHCLGSCYWHWFHIDTCDGRCHNTIVLYSGRSAGEDWWVGPDSSDWDSR